MLGVLGIDQDFGDRRHGSEEEYTPVGNNVKPHALELNFLNPNPGNSQTSCVASYINSLCSSFLICETRYLWEYWFHWAIPRMNETVHVKPLSWMPGARYLVVVLLGNATHTLVRNERIN